MKLSNWSMASCMGLSAGTLGSAHGNFSTIGLRMLTVQVIGPMDAALISVIMAPVNGNVMVVSFSLTRSGQVARVSVCLCTCAQDVASASLMAAIALIAACCAGVSGSGVGTGTGAGGGVAFNAWISACAATSCSCSDHNTPPVRSGCATPEALV